MIKYYGGNDVQSFVASDIFLFGIILDRHKSHVYSFNTEEMFRVNSRQVTHSSDAVLPNEVLFQPPCPRLSLKMPIMINIKDCHLCVTSILRDGQRYLRQTCSTGRTGSFPI